MIAIAAVIVAAVIVPGDDEAGGEIEDQRARIGPIIEIEHVKDQAGERSTEAKPSAGAAAHRGAARRRDCGSGADRTTFSRG